MRCIILQIKVNQMWTQHKPNTDPHRPSQTQCKAQREWWNVVAFNRSTSHRGLSISCCLSHFRWRWVANASAASVWIWALGFGSEEFRRRNTRLLYHKRFSHGTHIIDPWKIPNWSTYHQGAREKLSRKIFIVYILDILEKYFDFT